MLRLLLLASVSIASLTPFTGAAAELFVYFGTHRSGTNIGFSLGHFDTDTGVLTKPEFR